MLLHATARNGGAQAEGFAGDALTAHTRAGVLLLMGFP